MQVSFKSSKATRFFNAKTDGMDRDEEIQKIGNWIQFQLNKLKELDCPLNMSNGAFGIFDNSIPTEMHKEYVKEIGSYDNQKVFHFDTSIIPK